MKECPTCKFCFDDGTTVCPNDRHPLESSLACETILGGRYQLERRLGKGGMGTVFKAKHKFIKTLHAIKIISPEVVKLDETLLLRFHQEAVLAASIRHPNVVTVTDYGIENNNMPYLVMEFIDGISLTDYLQLEKRLSPEKAYEVLSQISLGLSEAHKKGIVHRDLKPLNVMLKNGSPQNKGVKVLDFGLAKIKTAESYASLVQAKTTNVLGSPLYMSPEQWSNENIDHRADIYSIGVMLFQMLAGEPPFTGETLVSLMYKHLQNEPPTFASLGVSVPPEIEAVVRRTLAKEKEQRPATVEQLLLEFEQALSKINPQFGQITEGRLDFISSDPLFSVGETSDSESNYIQSLLSPSENQAINTFLNLPKTVDLSGNEHLAQEFIQAQNRLEDARYQETQAAKLAQEFAAAQRDAEEARQKAIEAQQKLEEEARQRIQAELENKLAAEREAREKAEAEAKLLLAEAKARKEAEERAKASAQAALEAQQRAELERQKAEKESQQRQIEEQTRRRAEEAAIKLAAEAAAAKRQYEEAKKEAEAEAYRRLEAEQRHKKIAEEIRRNEEYVAEQRRIAEAKAAQEIKEQVGRLEKQAFDAEQKADEARLLIENEARKRREAEAARIKAEEEARRLAEEIIAAQKRLEEMQQLAESEARKREQEAEARQKAENSARSLIEKAKQEASLKASGEITESGNGAANKDISGILPDHPFGERQQQTQAQISIETTANVFETNQIPKSNFLKKSVLFAAIPILLAAAVGFYFIFRPANETLVNNNVGESNTNQNIDLGLRNNREVSTNSANSVSERLKNKMVKIAGGSFQMGRDDVSPSEGQFYGAQFPAHTVSVADFYLDQTEVTIEEYAQFIAETGHAAPENWQNGKPFKENKDLPVTNVSYFDARDFSNWISKRENTLCRLPSEEEWEYAARSGARQNVFPWGNEWIAGRANVATGTLREVGASGDVTELWGIKDMMGNVIEWTSSPFEYYPNFPENLKNSLYKNSGKFTLRGLSFSPEGSSLKKTDLNFTYRQPASGGVKQNYIGFRLACNSK